MDSYFQGQIDAGESMRSSLIATQAAFPETQLLKVSDVISFFDAHLKMVREDPDALKAAKDVKEFKHDIVVH